MNYSHRFFLYAPLAVFIALLAAIGLYWQSVAHAFFAKLDAANGHEISPGVTLHFASRTEGGFPFRLESVMQNVRIDVATSFGPATWTAEHFALHALSYGADQIIFEAAGKQTVSWYDSSRTQHVWSFVPGSMRASSIVSSGSLARFDLDIVGIGSPEVSASRFQFHLRRNPDHDAVDFVLDANGAHLSPPLQSGFGDTLKDLELEGSFIPGTPLLPLLDARRDWRSAFETWRQGAGHLDVTKFDVAWGKLDASGHGRLSLDAAHRPQGTLALKIDGYRDFLAANIPVSSDTPLAAALRADSTAANPDVLSAPLSFGNGMAKLGATAGGVVNPVY